MRQLKTTLAALHAPVKAPFHAKQLRPDQDEESTRSLR